MNRVKELRIDSTLWATAARLVNLLDFEPEKVSIETKNNANNNMRIHNVRYKIGDFYLTINNLRSYFNFNNNLGTLTMFLIKLINKISIIKYGKTFLKLLMEDIVN